MDSIVKILIVEDEIIIADYIFNILKKEGCTNVKMAHKYNSALEIIETFQPEIILMDINLNGENSGIELAKSKAYNTIVIFLTGQNDEGLMSQALATNPESYLTKPIKKQDLIAAVKLALLKKQSKIVSIKNGYDYININHESILFIKSDNNYIDIQTHSTKYSIRNSLDKFLEELNNKNFVRVHRSFVINRSKVFKQTSTSVFIEKIEIPISKKYKFQI
ncbi:response regulator transcription factor [Flavobacterium jejuense]|uniref:Response regulator transcription factor n=1 Tax=Flavobacterium jejuense TaxID=1544455 RepID=A0ABX0J2C3_9FLAO|nr:response regulator [Flavobacterium jejuense]NHN28134.1 response regulator transcription factor [Flavobacterium jejuense]